jgi:hypothetical protein
MLSWAKAHRAFASAIAVAALALLGLGIYWFGPQRLFLDREVAEGLPTPVAAGDPPAGEEPMDEPAAVKELASGDLRSLEHATSGLVRVVELGDGSRFVRLEGLDTSDGPDLRIYLTDQPLSEESGVADSPSASGWRPSRLHAPASRTFATIRITTTAATATRYPRKTVKSCRFR